VIRIARSEMGQGTLTGLAQLGRRRARMRLEEGRDRRHQPVAQSREQTRLGRYGTGGSRGIRVSQDYVRKGGAAARMMLLQAAADQWKVPVGELSVTNGIISHGAKKISYGKVAAAAAKITPPIRRRSSSRIRRPGPSPANR
jgi:isoquinoline 1-oxidoreductase beta subunit